MFKIKKELMILKTFELDSGKEVEVLLYYSHTPQGYGHYRIICEFQHCGENCLGYTTTTNSMFIDEINKLKQDGLVYDAQKRYDEEFFRYLELQVLQEIQEIEDEIEEELKKRAEEICTRIKQLKQ